MTELRNPGGGVMLTEVKNLEGKDYPKNFHNYQGRVLWDDLHLSAPLRTKFFPEQPALAPAATV